MEFEDILKDVGGFGFYQKMLVVVFLLPSYIVIPWFSMNMVFMSDTPDHWCYVPEVANSNLSLDLQKQLIGPPRDSSCSMYDINYTQILSSMNWTVDSTWPTKECNNGWQYDITDYDATVVTRWDMVCKDSHYSSLVLSMIFIGNIFGTPACGYFSDRLGRRAAFFLHAFIVAVTEISSAFCSNLTLFLILRAINGSVMASFYIVGYIILLELVNTDIRSQITALSSTFWTFGLCLLPLIAWLTRNWRYLSFVTASCSGGLLLYWKLLPESPSWLISQERYDEATATMMKISKINGKNIHKRDQLHQKILKLSDKIKQQRASEQKHSPVDFFKYPTLRKRFLLVTACWIGNLIPYFGLSINVKNLSGSEFLNFFLISVVEIPAYFITWVFIERLGRRWCLVSGFAVAFIFFMIPVIIAENTTVSIVASVLAKFGASSAYMTLFQQSAELFPTPLRVVGLAMSRTISMGLTLMVPYIVYLAKFGDFLPFLVFAIISFVAGICASYLPETMNVKLPQTVEDVENFARNVKFFSCSLECETELDSVNVQNNGTLATVSAIDLYSSFNNSAVDQPAKSELVLLNGISALSKHEIINTAKTSI